MIFAAGLGTRLRPITDSVPKAMVPIARKPLIQHVIQRLSDFGFDELTINVHHFPEQILQFLKENNNFGLKINISDESDELLETGGGIKKASHFLQGTEPFLIHNVDILSNANLSILYKEHIRNKNLATLLVSNRPSSRSLLFDENKRLCGWMNNRTGEIKSPYKDINPDDFEHFSFSGIHVLSPEIFKYMDKQPRKFSIIDFYLSIANQVNIQGFVDNQLKLVDVGKLGSLSKAEDLYNTFSCNKIDMMRMR